MKTTLDLPDDLVPMVRRCLELPLVECAHEARPGDEITPERVTEMLLDEEVGPQASPVPTLPHKAN